MLNINKVEINKLLFYNLKVTLYVSSETKTIFGLGNDETNFFVIQVILLYYILYLC